MTATLPLDLDTQSPIVFNQRFVAYAASNGLTPDEQLAHDRKVWPGGRMTGFILWISERKRAYRALHPEMWIGLDIADHDHFTDFLNQPTNTTK